MSLQITMFPINGGRVVTNPPIGPDGTYPEGQKVAVTAQPNRGYEFVRWSGVTASTENPTTVVMSDNVSLVAVFTTIQPTPTPTGPTVSLQITMFPVNGGKVTTDPPVGPGGTYPEGQKVAITAHPNTGYEFVQWSGATASTENPTTVVMSDDLSLIVFFTAILPTPTPTHTPAPTPSPLPTPTPSVSWPVLTADTYWYTLSYPPRWGSVSTSGGARVEIQDLDEITAVQIVVEGIDAAQYPTLDSYLTAWEPAPDQGWSNFQIVAQQRIRTNLPVQAQEFRYTFTFQESPFEAVEHWYVLGKYLVRLWAIASESAWTSAAYSDQLLQTLISFDPSSYTSAEFGYSMAHPLSWEPLQNANYDYQAWDSLTEQQVSVQIASAQGYTSTVAYGDDHVVTYDGNEATINSRQVVFAGRPNPGYRMEYTAFDASAGREVRGAVLITLSGDNAIWVFVEGWTEDWVGTRSLADDIFLRFAVRG